MAVDIESNPDHILRYSNGDLVPCIRIDVKPPFSQSGKPISVQVVHEVPMAAVNTSAIGVWVDNSLLASDNIVQYFFFYDPKDEKIIVFNASKFNSSTNATKLLNYFLNSDVYQDYFFREEDAIDFLNVDGLTGTITQSVGKMVAVGLLLGIGLLSIKVGITSLDKFLDNKFWYKRFENERSALEKEYKRLSRVYRNDPLGQKNLDRRFARRNTRLYEKYADYGVEKEDLIRTE